MASNAKKYRRSERKKQRKARKKLNQRLKNNTDMSWAQRRKVIRNRRRSDRHHRVSKSRDIRARGSDQALGKYTAAAEARKKAQARQARQDAHDAGAPAPPQAHSSGGGRSFASTVRQTRVPRPGPGPRMMPGLLSRGGQQGGYAQRGGGRGPVAQYAQQGGGYPQRQYSAQPQEYWDDRYEPIYEDFPEWDPAPNGYDNWDYDPYDDAILIDVDGVEFLDRDDQELWDERANDIIELAGEFAGEVIAMSGEATLEFGADLDPRKLFELVGKQYLDTLWAIAHEDGWNDLAYQRDAEVVVDAVNAAVEAFEDAAVENEAKIAGFAGEFGVASAALMAIPAIAAMVPSLVSARQKSADRKQGRKNRRANRASKRANKAEQHAADLETKLQALEEQGAEAGVFDLEDGEWTARAQAGSVAVRAKVGNRAAIADLGSKFYLVHEVAEGVPTAVIQSRMNAAVASASAAIQATPAAFAGAIDVG